MMKTTSVLLMTVLVLLGGCGSSSDTAPEAVDTTTGSFYPASDSPEGIAVYRGIKYAEGGQAYRWQPPVATPDFTTPVTANDFGASCAQVDMALGEAETLVSMKSNAAAIGVKGSEDCLYLNVYAPQSGGLKPVLVWIHGGAFLLGSGSNAIYDPVHIVEQEDMVVVTLNYRLGVFGFLDLPDADKKAGVTSGNFGLMDQTMAISWVHENIARFGGDPDRVTIMGESAGSMSVGFHLVNDTAASADYFRAAIMQSPYMGFPIKTESHAAQVGTFTASTLKAQCAAMGVSETMTCLYETLTTKDVIVYGEVPGLLNYLIKTLGTGSFSNIFPYEPYIDGERVKSNLIEGNITKPLLIGNTKSESNYFLALLQSEVPITSEAEYKLFLATMFADLNRTELLQMYPYNSADPAGALETLITDYAFKCASTSMVEGAGATDAYLYKFDFVSGFNRFKDGEACDAPAVCHAADLPYTFDQFYFSDNTPIPEANITANETDFSAAMIGQWGEFAKTVSLNGFVPHTRAGDNYIEMNNTASYFYKYGGNFAAEHNCDYWDAYYKVQKNP